MLLGRNISLAISEVSESEISGIKKQPTRWKGLYGHSTKAIVDLTYLLKHNDSSWFPVIGGEKRGTYGANGFRIFLKGWPGKLGVFTAERRQEFSFR